MSNVSEWIVAANFFCLIWIIRGQFILAQALDRIETREEKL